MKPIKIEDIPTRFMRRYCWTLLLAFVLPALVVAVVIDAITLGWRETALMIRNEILPEVLSDTVEVWRQ